MSIHEIYRPKEQIEDIIRAAEFTAASIYDNLRSYQRGERSEFTAIFPINIASRDEKTGKPNGVNDIAHGKFLDMLSMQDIADDYIILSNGSKLYFRQDSFLSDSGEEIPYQMTYATDPITLGLDSSTID